MTSEENGWWKECRKVRPGGWNIFVCIPHVLDYFFRTRNFTFHRSYPDCDSATEPNASWLKRLLHMPGIIYKNIRCKTCSGMGSHSPLATILPILLFYFIIYGPTLGWRGWEPVLVLMVTVTLFLMLVCKLHERKMFLVHWAMITGVAVYVFVRAKPGSTEHGGEIYQHMLIPAVWVLLTIGLLLSRFISHAVLGALHQKENNEATDYLRLRVKYTELFEKPEYPTVSGWMVFRAFFTVPLYHPLELLYFSTIPLYWADDRDLMKVLFWVFLGLAWLVLWVAGLHNRFMAFFVMLKRSLFVGGQLVVSVMIIVVGYARLADYGYVSTLVESLPGYVLFTYFFSAYVLFWTYEYWINRSLCEQMFPLLVAPANPAGKDEFCQNRKYQITRIVCRFIKDVLGLTKKGRLGQAPYVIADDVKSTEVKRKGRVMQIHAGARFVVIGEKDGGEDRDDANSGNRKECFHIYERLELFHRIIFEHKKIPGETLDDQPARIKAGTQFSDLQKRVRFYFAMLNILLAASVYVGIKYASGLDQTPAVRVNEIVQHDQHLNGLTNLRKTLFGDDGSTPPEQVITVAVSGGGTRAALYASSVLRGLGEMGVLQDVVLASGVSGGGVALAYFASRRDQLVSGRNDPLDSDAWQCFHDTMAEPFIQDVIEGAFERRIAGGSRLGKLLDESFERRFYDTDSKQSKACESSDNTVRRLGNINAFESMTPDGRKYRKIGVILNTALSGHPYYDSWMYGRLGRNADVDSAEFSSNISSGTRLILTNLENISGFPQVNMTPPERVIGQNLIETLSVQSRDQVLKYVVVQDPTVKLSTAAALTANFPPVFPDAAVDITPANDQGRTDRYWVTDGGATENRGIVSLLIALQESLSQQCELVCGQALESITPPPRIHIVVADASASSVDYAPSRGINPKFGAAEHLADQLIVELLKNITVEYKRLGGKPQDIKLHYLNMPSPFRIRGGLGTHWMLQDEITFVTNETPYEDKAKDEKLRLPGKVAKQMIERLYQPMDKRKEIHIRSDDDNVIKRAWAEVWQQICIFCDTRTLTKRVEEVWKWVDQDNADEVWLNLCRQVVQADTAATCEEYESQKSSGGSP